MQSGSLNPKPATDSCAHPQDCLFVQGGFGSCLMLSVIVVVAAVVVVVFPAPNSL